MLCEFRYLSVRVWCCYCGLFAGLGGVLAGLLIVIGGLIWWFGIFCAGNVFGWVLCV